MVLEHDREVAGGVELAVLVTEDVDEVVALGGAGNRVGVVDSLLEIGVALGVGHRAENVGHRYLKGDVHTSLEVEAESHAEFLYFVECVAEIDFFVSDVLDVLAVSLAVRFGTVAGLGRFGQCILVGFVLIVVGHHGERKVEQADQHQKNRDDSGHNASQSSFALHCCDKIVLKWLIKFVCYFKVVCC